KRAMQQLAKQGANAVSAVTEVLKKSSSTVARRNAVWALTRIDSPAAREAVRWALLEGNPSVRHVAMHSISLWADTEATQELLNVLQVPEPQAQRVAAEALGRIGNRLNSSLNSGNGGRVSREDSMNWIVPGLLTAGAAEHDRVLEHSITYALIETDIPLGTAGGLNSSSGYEQRAALTALDPIDHGQVHDDQIIEWVTSSETGLRHTAWLD